MDSAKKRSVYDSRATIFLIFHLPLLAFVRPVNAFTYASTSVLLGGKINSLHPAEIIRNTDLNVILAATTSSSSNVVEKQENGFTHADITWKLGPPQEMPTLEAIKWRSNANLLRLQQKDPPLVVCPPGGQALLEAFDASTQKRIGKFGIVTEQPGPTPPPPIQETIKQIYGVSPDEAAFGQVGAIKFMFVEKECRRRNVGKLALEVISLILAEQGCDYIILVADDKTADSDARLVAWYETSGGYTVAPLLQDLLGSPGGKFGITMIAPTSAVIPKDCKIIWW